jgi:hypothetical protein
MTKRFFSLLVALVLLFGALGVTPTQVIAESQPQAAEAPTLLQFSSGGHVLGFANDGMYAATGSHALHVNFVNANRVQPQAPNAAASTAGSIAPLSSVTYLNLWPGISLDYTAAGGVYTTTYSLAPGADVNDIQLRYNAPVSLNENGTLTITFETGSLIESAPIAWQEMNGRRVNVDVAFSLSGEERGENEVSFVLGQYDPRYPLTIDPTLTWNTFLGGSGGDEGYSIAVDGSGNVYVSGYSFATWGNPLRAHTGGDDAFAAKLNSSGVLQWHTFLGGSGSDRGYSIVVDGSGNVYIGGSSYASWGSPQRAHAGGDNNDAFVAKLDSSGVLTWNTFIGGSGDDFGSSIAVDSSGNVYVGGSSQATWDSPLRSFSGVQDAFVAELSPSGILQWHTFLGGSGPDGGFSIAVDGSGNVFVGGGSGATWGSPLRAFSGGTYDAFAAKLDTSGALTWNTFLGGSGSDRCFSIVVDANGNIYVGGSSDATWGSPQRAYTADLDAFAVKLDSSGNLIWNTFLGGSDEDWGRSIAVDGSRNVYVSGSSRATWGSPLWEYTINGDAFAAKLDSSGNLTWNTFLGGNWDDYGESITVDGSGNVYVGGSSGATWGSPLRAYTGSHDAFVAKISEATFADVPTTHSAWNYIERLYAAGITAGCGSGNYCPLSEVNRAQMAIFLLRGMHGGSYTPPAVGGSTGFGDVPLDATYAPWVKQLATEGITAGCGGGNFCPLQVVNRAQMAIFLLRAKHGAAYTPPAVGASTGFGDVPLDASYAPWVKQLAAEGITAGCGNGNFCPLQNVNRAQMAIFLVRAFSLP